MDKKDILVRRNCFEFSAIIILESGISITKVRQPNTYEKWFFFKFGGKFSFTHGI